MATVMVLVCAWAVLAFLISCVGAQQVTHNNDLCQRLAKLDVDIALLRSVQAEMARLRQPTYAPFTVPPTVTDCGQAVHSPDFRFIATSVKP